MAGTQKYEDNLQKEARKRYRTKLDLIGKSFIIIESSSTNV